MSLLVLYQQTHAAVISAWPGMRAAWRIAASTNAVFFDSEHSHPGMKPANASATNAVSPNRLVSIGT